MKSLLKSLPFLLSVTIAISIFVTTEAIGEENFIAPVPDKTKLLPSNDGGPDGCDSSRFNCVMGGEAVLDKQTGVVWARDPYLINKGVTWEDAIKVCDQLEIAGKKGWRLPTQQEFLDLVDSSQSEPALPEGHPFLSMENMASMSGLSAFGFWTSTDIKDDSERAWIVMISVGRFGDSLKLLDSRVWPVRDGE